MEAKMHCGTAVSLVLAAGMHKIRSLNHEYNYSAPIAVQAESLVYMPPARDGEDEAERIAGFWAVYTLSKVLGVALESPVSVCGTFEAPGMCIDTPWPLDVDESEQKILAPEIQGSFTIRSFLTGTTGPSTFSYSTMSIQAAVLFHRATHLNGTWSPSMQQRDYQTYASVFQSTHALIDALQSSLPPLARTTPVASPSSSRPEYHYQWRTLLLAHSLVDAAVIKLHGHFAYAYNTAGGYSADSASREYCVDAAMRIVAGCGFVSASEVGFVNPIMGTLWVSASNVLIDEIVRIRRLKGSATWLPAVSSGDRNDISEDEVKNGLYSILKTIRSFSNESAFMKYQVKKVEEAITSAIA